jgi:hypothetical protein
MGQSLFVRQSTQVWLATSQTWPRQSVLTRHSTHTPAVVSQTDRRPQFAVVVQVIAPDPPPPVMPFVPPPPVMPFVPPPPVMLPPVPPEPFVPALP